MSATLTFTGNTGAGVALSGAVFSGITNISIDTERKMLQCFTSGSLGAAPYKEFDLNGIGTVTVTVSGTTWSITMS